MEEKVKARMIARRKRRRMLLVVRLIVGLIILAHLGFLAYYMSRHPLRIRVGGKARLLAVKPAELDFGRVGEEAPGAKTVTIKNRTRSEMRIHRIDFTSAAFRLKEKSKGLVLAPRGEMALTVLFKPRVGGTSTGEMRVRLRGRSTPELVVPVRGEALLPQLAISVTSLDFGEVETRAGARRAIKLRNVGTRPLKVTSVTARGQGFGLAAPFTSAAVDPGSSHTVEVLFVPPKLGESTGELLIASNDPAKPELTVALCASYGTAIKREREKAQALALLQEAKRDLSTAYAYLTFHSTNRSLMHERHRMGYDLLDRAWPKYEHANQKLRALDPALEDKEFSLDSDGVLQRH